VTQGVDEGSWWVGRIQQIRRKHNFKWQLLTHPVDLMSLKARRGNTTPLYEVYFSYFSKHQGHLKFRYDQTDAKWIDIETVITSVTFTLNTKTNVYSLNPEDAQCLDDFVKTKNGNDS